MKSYIKNLSISLFLGLLVTLLSYSFFYSVKYPELSDKQISSLENCSYTCESFQTKSETKSGFPFRSSYLDSSALTIEYKTKGPVNPIVSITFTKTLEFYLNIIFWASLTFASHEIITRVTLNKSSG